MRRGREGEVGVTMDKEREQGIRGKGEEDGGAQGGRGKV